VNSIGAAGKRKKMHDFVYYKSVVPNHLWSWPRNFKFIFCGSWITLLFELTTQKTIKISKKSPTTGQESVFWGTYHSRKLEDFDCPKKCFQKKQKYVVVKSIRSLLRPESKKIMKSTPLSLRSNSENCAR